LEYVPSKSGINTAPCGLLTAVEKRYDFSPEPGLNLRHALQNIPANRQMKMSRLRRTVLALILVACAVAAQAEDGHELWLRYRTLGALLLSTYRPALTALVTEGGTPTLDAARDEMVRGLGGLLGQSSRVRSTANTSTR
jgi:hypothetical protein